MFSNEVKVNGNYVKGSIKKQTGFPYKLYSELNFINNHWSSNELRSIADELHKVAEEIDRQSS
ncbi:hypothetical protein K1X09_34400 [Paenibacillus lautus]|nr:hypothetical protein [Paenibacillus lautus]